jgi:hypothetical protein
MDTDIQVLKIGSSSFDFLVRAEIWKLVADELCFDDLAQGT